MENDVTMEEMSYELDLMLRATLYFAGVKKDKLEEACDAYIESIDDVLENSDLDGVDEIIYAVGALKKSHKELFK